MSAAKQPGIMRVVDVAVAGPHALRLRFDDGLEGEVDLRSHLIGPVFVPLRESAYFARVRLDERCGTVVWPNEADFAPEFLHDLVRKNSASG